MLSLLNFLLQAALVSSREEQALDGGKNRREGGRMLPSYCRMPVASSIWEVILKTHQKML